MAVTLKLHRVYTHLSGYISILLWVLFAWMVISFFQKLAAMKDQAGIFNYTVTFAWQIILLLAVISAFNKIGDSIKEELENMKSKVVGLVIAHGRITLEDLAIKMKMTVSDVETIISLINADKVAEIKIDPRTNTATIGRLEEVGIEEKKEEGEEKKDLFLSRLEKLHKEGYISDEIYERLKKEYEKR